MAFSSKLIGQHLSLLSFQLAGRDRRGGARLGVTLGGRQPRKHPRDTYFPPSRPCLHLLEAPHAVQDVELLPPLGKIHLPVDIVRVPQVDEGEVLQDEAPGARRGKGREGPLVIARHGSRTGRPIALERVCVWGGEEATHR